MTTTTCMSSSATVLNPSIAEAGAEAAVRQAAVR